MVRSTGPIFVETRPATIIRSACRGDARNTSAPKRLRSNLDETEAIISMAQQASPNVSGQILFRRAQLTTSSSLPSKNGDPPGPMLGTGVAESWKDISVTVRAISNSSFSQTLTVFYVLEKHYVHFFTISVYRKSDAESNSHT